MRPRRRRERDAAYEVWAKCGAAAWPKRAGCLVDEAWALVRDTWAGSGVDHIEYTCVAENSNGCGTGWIRKEERVGQLRFNGAGEIRQLMRAGGPFQGRVDPTATLGVAASSA